MYNRPQRLLLHRAALGRMLALMLCGITMAQCSSSDKDKEFKFESYATLQAVDIKDRNPHFQLAFTEGPFSWIEPSNADELPGIDSRTTGGFTAALVGEPQLDFANLVVHIAVNPVLEIEAHGIDGAVIGTMTLQGLGEETFDVNPLTVEIDAEEGVIRRGFGSPFREGRNVGTLQIQNATGVFTGIQPVGEWEVFISAHEVIPIDPNLSLIENLQVTGVAIFGEMLIKGIYSSSDTNNPSN